MFYFSRSPHSQDMRFSVWPLAIGIACLGLSLSLALAVYRGPWLDELWSLYMSDPSQSFLTLANTSWRSDPHPPAFIALMRTMTTMLPHDYVVLRLINLLWAAAVVAFLWRQHHNRLISTHQASVIALLFFASPLCLSYTAELRSYFMMLCYILMAGLSLQTLLFAVVEKKPVPVEYMFYWVLAGTVAVNSHYMASLMMSCLIGVVVIFLFFKKEWRFVRNIILSAIVMYVPLVLVLWWQFSAFTNGTEYNWISTTPAKAILLITKAVPLFTAYNWPLLIAGVLALAAGIRQKNQYVMVHLLFMLSVLLFFVILFSINYSRPIIVGRYLLPAAPILLIACAMLAAPYLQHRQWTLAILVFAIGVLGDSANNQYQHRQRWHQAAEIISTNLEQCPSGKIYAYAIDDNLRKDQVMAMGYHLVADEYDFSVIVVRKGEALAAPESCPNFLWLEETTYPKGLMDGTPEDILKRLGLEYSQDKGVTIHVLPTSAVFAFAR